MQGTLYTMNTLRGSWSREYTPSLVAKSLFYYLQSAGHFVSGPAYYTKRKNYDTMLLMYTIRGTGKLIYRNRSYDLTPGTVCIIDCTEEQIYGSCSDNISGRDMGEAEKDPAEEPANRANDANGADRNDAWVFDWIHFNGSESRGYVNHILNAMGPVIHIGQSSGIPGYISRIHRLLKANDENFDVKASCILVEILTELMLKVSSGKEGEGVPALVQGALHIIERQYARPLALDTIAERLCISKYHLSRLFKLHTGYSLYEYLIKFRLSQGKVLLKTTDDPVCEIARKVGYDSASHFIKVFRQHENITPLKFRKYWR